MANTTKKLLANSLKALLSHKTLDKITVKEICENCNVNRQTFYYNFQDIYDLTQWALKDEFENLVKDNATYELRSENLQSVFLYAQNNKRMILNMFNSIARGAFDRYIKQLFRPIIRTVVDNRAENINITEENKEFITDVYVMAIIGILCEWIEDDMQGEYLKKLEKFKLLTDGSVDYMISKFSE